jgi:hypothetical protein
MRSRFILTVAASLLAGTIAANAQTGQPNEKGVDQRTDDATTSANPNRPSGPQGTVGSGATKKNSNPAMKDDTPAQPGGVSPSAPPQGGAGGTDSQPRPK